MTRGFLNNIQRKNWLWWGFLLPLFRGCFFFQFFPTRFEGLRPEDVTTVQLVRAQWDNVWIVIWGYKMTFVLVWFDLPIRLMTETETGQTESCPMKSFQNMDPPQKNRMGVPQGSHLEPPEPPGWSVSLWLPKAILHSIQVLCKKERDVCDTCRSRTVRDFKFWAVVVTLHFTLFCAFLKKKMFYLFELCFILERKSGMIKSKGGSPVSCLHFTS